MTEWVPWGIGMKDKGGRGRIWKWQNSRRIIHNIKLGQLTVALLIGCPCVPTCTAAVWVAGIKWYLRWVTRMRLSCRRVVTLGLPDRGRSCNLPVSTYRSARRWIIRHWRLNRRARREKPIPASSIPRARMRSLVIRRGIVNPKVANDFPWPKQ